ncbi:cytochrome P450 [Hoeflea sp. CAU 1731]
MSPRETETLRPLPVTADEFRPDPHQGYALYRPQTAVIDFGDGVASAIRHDDVVAMMTDPRTRQLETEALAFRGISSGALHDFYSNSLLLSNPPDHARRRAPLSRTFASKLMELWRPRVRELVEGMIDDAAKENEFDVLTQIASPLPSRIIAEILGAPEEDAPRFAEMVYTMSRGLGGFRMEDFPGIETVARDLCAYVENLLEERRRQPRDDFLSHYLERVSGENGLDPKETMIQVVSLIIGGSDTTRFAFTMLVSLLLTHRDQWEDLCRNPDLVPGAVREGLRYEPSVGSIARVVLEPLDIGGVAFKPGALVQLSMLSAQRDERIFADPQRFDIRREDHPRWSVSFGMGAHRCLGEALARAELEEALAALARKLPNLALAGEPARAKGHVGIRGVGPLVVRSRS